MSCLNGLIENARIAIPVGTHIEYGNNKDGVVEWWSVTSSSSGTTHVEHRIRTGYRSYQTVYGGVETMRFLSSPFPYANEFREGDVILYEGEECVIVERVLRDSSGVEQGGHTYYHYVNRAVLDNGVALDLRRGDRYEIIGHKEKRFI